MIFEDRRENFGELVRLAAELDENGLQQVSDTLLATITEVKVEDGDWLTQSDACQEPLR